MKEGKETIDVFIRPEMTFMKEKMKLSDESIGEWFWNGLVGCNFEVTPNIGDRIDLTHIDEEQTDYCREATLREFKTETFLVVERIISSSDSIIDRKHGALIELWVIPSKNAWDINFEQIRKKKKIY